MNRKKLGSVVDGSFVDTSVIEANTLPTVTADDDTSRDPVVDAGDHDNLSDQSPNDNQNGSSLNGSRSRISTHPTQADDLSQPE